MADFRQLALEFVLADDVAKLTGNAQKAASEIQAAPANSNPVARWVESVQPWMPSNNVDEMADGEDSTNWTARAKALEFLSRTLDFLGRDVLKHSQVKLLVGFFGAMFDIDHKAGILASASALSRIIEMKCFDPKSGLDIIEKVCALKDDFPRQIAKTRLAVYELLHALLIKPEVAQDLHKRQGPEASFMHDLLQLCQSERDPDCLMVWFDTICHFLQNYDGSEKIFEEVFGMFKSYFPITLPRTAQSGLTPEELKLQLRKCFSANCRLAKPAFSFLLSKLDQGDGVTVNVKVDVLRTIKACIEDYQKPEESVEPYVNQIWGSLKYEVRNGEIEDTIWATLEVLKTLAVRLSGDALRDYTLTVTRDCVNDLSNPVYTAPAGRLLVSVLSANASAFVLIAAPTITHIKENLRHPKSTLHSQDLLKVLHIVLETRLMLAEADMTAQEATDFKAIDPIITTLYNDVYKNPLAISDLSQASYDDIKISSQAVQGAGALICQQPIKPDSSSGASEAAFGLDAPAQDTSYSKICSALLALVTPSVDSAARKPETDILVNEALRALQRAIRVCPAKFKAVVDDSMAAIHDAWSSPSPRSGESVQAYGSLLAFIGCSELPSSSSDGLSQYLYLICSMAQQLSSAVSSGADSGAICAIAASIQSAARYFVDATAQLTVGEDDFPTQSTWISKISQKYPILGQLEVDGSFKSPFGLPTTPASNVRSDYILTSLYIARFLYRCLTKASSSGNAEFTWSAEVEAMEEASRFQLLYLVSNFAGFVVHEMSESQQKALQVEDYALTLFHEEEVSKEQSATSRQWLISGDLNVLFFGLIEATRPAVAARLFENGVAEDLIRGGITSSVSSSNRRTQPVMLSILAVLANKCKIETSEPLMRSIEERLEGSMRVTEVDSDEGLHTATAVFAIANGLLRRYSGKQAQSLLRQLGEAPRQAVIGHRLARRLEAIAAPHSSLTKDKFAVVKPLWMQKCYVELVKPMIQAAAGPDAPKESQLLRTNFSVGVLAMVKHMPFSIFEENADGVLRIAIAVAQNVGSGLDLQASLDVTKTIIAESSEKAQDHLRSITNICIDAFSDRAVSAERTQPEWLPADYPVAVRSASVQMACGRSALEIVGGLPKIFESRYVVPLAPLVQRELTAACGHKVRDVRKAARSARTAWADMK